jgi:hypothetical protein
MKKVDSILNAFHDTTPGNSEGLLAAFQKMLSISPMLSEALSRESFIYKLRLYLQSPNALVRLYVLKIIDSMMSIPKAQVLLLGFSIQSRIAKMSISDGAVLVRELATRLCTKFRKLL